MIKEPKQKAVVILSGGLDSTTLVYYLKDIYDLYILSFNYGQRHKKELEKAKITTKKLKLPHQIVDISDVKKLLGGSALTDNIKVPEGHYEEESMRLTVVPNRNMIMLSIAVGYAISIKASSVFYAAHGGDHAIYPDCREEFVKKLSKVTQICDYQPIDIKTPFINFDKGDIVSFGKNLEVPFEDTCTCYVGEKKACGKCGSCQERLAAFRKAQITDPLEYVSREIIEKK